MQRNISFSVTTTGDVSPAIPQYGGVQGEDNTTKISFVFPHSLTIPTSASGRPVVNVRMRFVGGDGTSLSSDFLTVSVVSGTLNASVQYRLPKMITALGGQVSVRLVFSEIVNGEEVVTAYTKKAVLYFDDATSENGTPFWRGVSEMLAATVAASQSADASAEAAADSVSDVENAVNTVMSAGVCRYKGNVADDAALLAISEKLTGDIYTVTSTQSNRLWNGSVWVAISQPVVSAVSESETKAVSGNAVYNYAATKSSVAGLTERVDALEQSGGGGGTSIESMSLAGTILTIEQSNGDSVTVDLAPIFATRNFVYYDNGTGDTGVSQSGSVLTVTSGVTVSQSGSTITIGG